MTSIAIASSDWHIHKFKRFDIEGSRLNWGLQAGAAILNKAMELQVPHLFMGDLYHTPKEVENETATRTMILLQKSGINTYAIAGNHDQCQKNTLNNNSPNYLEGLRAVLPNFHYPPGQVSKSLYIRGIDYMNYNKELVERIKSLKEDVRKAKGLKILMLHTDIPGAKTPEGIEVGEADAMPSHLDKMFKDWDLVLCGHIHKPQKLSTKVYMMGSPIHQTQGDAGTEMGYWIIYDDGSIKFKKLKGFPKFIKLGKDEKPKDDINYYIPYEDVESGNSEIEEGTGAFNLNQDRSKLAKKYVKTVGIKSKSKREALVNILSAVE